MAPTTYENIFVLLQDFATEEVSMRLLVQVYFDPEQQRWFAIDEEGNKFSFAPRFDPQQYLCDNALLATLNVKAGRLTPLGGQSKSELNPPL